MIYSNPVLGNSNSGRIIKRRPDSIEPMAGRPEFVCFIEGHRNQSFRPFIFEQFFFRLSGFGLVTDIHRVTLLDCGDRVRGNQAGSTYYLDILRQAQPATQVAVLRPSQHGGEHPSVAVNGILGASDGLRASGVASPVAQTAEVLDAVAGVEAGPHR
jgi:hypothetical protein